MSRAFDAKEQAIAAYPNDKEKAIDLFFSYLDCSESDFEYEFNQTAEEYIFGDK